MKHSSAVELLSNIIGRKLCLTRVVNRNVHTFRMDIFRGLVSLFLPSNMGQLQKEKVRCKTYKQLKMLTKYFPFDCSVIGLNFDFLALNIVGFTLYGCYNVAMFWIDSIQVTRITMMMTQFITSPLPLNAFTV